MSGTQTQDSGNPFLSDGEYTPAAVELMRALSAHRQKTGHGTSSPEQVLAILADLGYRRPENRRISDADAVRLFTMALSKYQKENDIAFPSCQDVLEVADRLHYYRLIEETPTVIPGLPIDRRRREEDERDTPHERRSSTELSVQEQMELNDQEHRFLDALKDLREHTGRQFASSEELLSIVWSLGYRPLNSDGFPQEWLDDEDRCRVQIAFTRQVEQKLATNADGEFLTSRGILKIVEDVGFVQQ
ncbi:MAG: hypothetical protein WBH50_15085 [Fuerstiella sp.]